MNYLVLFMFLVLTFMISWWNAYSAGRGWTEVKFIGGWPRIVTWCAVVMSACGFTWVYLTLVTIAAVAFSVISVESADVMFNLGYVIIILPIIGSGFGLWANSLIVAYKSRGLGSIGVASWNTFAQARNIYKTARYAPGAMESVLSFFTRGKSRKSRESMLILLLVVLALSSGVITTAAIARKADRENAILAMGT